MIMGANVGTTMTSTLVSLTKIRSREKFEKAVMAKICHDLFNVLTMLVMISIEVCIFILCVSALNYLDLNCPDLHRRF